MKKLYVYFDRKVDEIEPDRMFMQVNDAVAIRSFTQILSEKGWMYNHADDYCVKYIGWIDNEGLHRMQPVVIAEAASIKKTIDAIEELKKENQAKELIQK